LLLTTLLLLATYTRTQVLRPQLFSVLMFALLVDRLRRSHQNRRLIEIPAVMCVWANLHGAWVVGMATLVVWITVETVEARVAQRFGAATPTPHSIPKAALLLSAALTATLLNPYGWAQWSFLRDTVGLSRTDISDWAPFIALPVPIIVLDLVMPALVLLSWFVYRRAVRLRDAAVVALLAFGTLRVGRVDAFLQVSIGLLFAPELLALFNGAAMRLARYERLRSETAVNFAAATALAVVAVASTAPRLTQIAVEGLWIPDRDAVRFLRAESPHTHLLTWFDWGEYAIWHLSGAGIRVSMDGRRETVYSPRVLNEHWAFYRNDANSWMYPDQIGADCIWLPRRLPIVARLREHGWNVAFESGRSIVLSRENGRTLIASSQDASPQFFPAE
jgi:hypothetical protein